MQQVELFILAYTLKCEDLNLSLQASSHDRNKMQFDKLYIQRLNGEHVKLENIQFQKQCRSRSADQDPKYFPVCFEIHSIFKGILQVNWKKNWEVFKASVKPVLKGHPYRRPKTVFETDYRLMQVKSIAECSKGSILQYF